MVPERDPTCRRNAAIALLVSGALSAAFCGATSAAPANPFDAHKSRQIARCQAIDEKAYRTGMIFNPKGQRTMFERSRCFHELAVAERDPALCGNVVERKSWSFDGSAIPEKSCLERVAQRIEKDRRDFAAKDFSRLHQLRSFAPSRNGNGRDFDFEVRTTGSMSGAYQLALEFTPAEGGEVVSVYDDTALFADTDSRKVILLRQSLLRENLGERFDQTEWTATVTLRFSKSASNRFYHDAIPTAVRSSRLQKRLRFADLPRWQPEPVK